MSASDKHEDVDNFNCWPVLDAYSAGKATAESLLTAAAEDCPPEQPCLKRLKLQHQSKRRPETLAHVSLARWWKVHGRNCHDIVLPSNCNPITILKAISR